MKQLLIGLFILLSIISCKTSKDDKVEITLYESYDAHDFFPILEKLNAIISQQYKDSIKHKVALLEKMQPLDSNKTFNENDYPVFKVLIPYTHSNGKGAQILDSSSVIGMSTEMDKAISYLKLGDSLFPKDFDWKVSDAVYIKKQEENSDKFKSVHAIKKHCEQIHLSISDIDSIFVTPTSLNIFELNPQSVSDLKGFDSYLIRLKLSKKLSNKLKNKTYTMAFKIDDIEYSYIASVVNFKNNPEQIIYIGEMDDKLLEVLKKIFLKNMIIKLNI